jgi:hypothetical protein
MVGRIVGGVGERHTEILLRVFVDGIAPAAGSSGSTLPIIAVRIGVSPDKPAEMGLATAVCIIRNQSNPNPSPERAHRKPTEEGEA